MHFLLGVGYSDGDLDYREENLIRHISVLLGLPTREYEAIKITFQHTNSDYRGSQQQNYGNQGSSYQRSNNNSNTTYHTESTDWAYTQLGITKAATDEDVKKAYRSMAKKFHPDRVANLGEAVVKEANIRFRKINEAYETIKKERGIS
ncbi:MAG: DnaJ domain-containing protein [Bacteroidales bacterium]|nr:DnaJ domain-containing protein [Candidatus Physcocola equi]